MNSVPRVTPQEVHPRVLTGEALLVCAYEDDARFRAQHLAGAISYNAFIANLAGISRSRELVFYCA